MTTLIATGSQAKLFQMIPKKGEVEVGMEPFVCSTVLARTTEDTPKMPAWFWDCHCGVYIYGTVEAIEKAYTQLTQFITEKLEDHIPETASSDSPTSFGLFKSKKQDIAVILGGGYYEETEQKLLDFLETLTDVEFGELGANYSEDNDFFDTLIEEAEALMSQQKEVNFIGLQIIREAYTYGVKHDLYEREDFEEDFPHVSKFLKIAAEQEKLNKKTPIQKNAVGVKKATKKI